MRCSIALAAITAFAGSALGRVYYEETFTDPDSINSFKPSKARDDNGAIKLSPGKWYSDEENSVGLQLVDDARFYAYAAKLKRPFNSKGKDFVVQFTVKYEQDIDCGGAYLKLLPPTLDPAEFDGDSKYDVMFGPDICGSTNRRVHAIINYNDTNSQIDKVIQPRGDQLTHQYTFWVKPDKTFEIRIDNKVQDEGKIEDFWKVLPEKQIPDPDAKKPEDWVDGPAMIEDTDDEKPSDWVDGPETIPDADAKKPEDWDDDMDGDWEPPMIANPEYKGEWKPQMIKNPEYKGEWTAPLIDNPDYEEDEDLAVFNIGYVGLDIWTVKSGTIFSNILITDDIDYASEFGNRTWADYVEAEIEAKKVVDEAEAKKVEEEREAKKAQEKEDEEKAEDNKDNEDDKSDAADEEDAASVVDELEAGDDAKEQKRANVEDEDEDKSESVESEEDTIAADEDANDQGPAEKEEEVSDEQEDAENEAKAAAKAKAERKAAKKAAAKKAAKEAKRAAEEAAKAAERVEEEDDDDEDDVVHDEL
ncbi:Calreticulin-domain-containing protein [Coemansia reversa NRRL 1564]|uniref:Calreticulin-domain-containing protein n=1 Tax=Coemansia reversa (strain ATCC 12441 / NRRL 1564) TaxID=763665 RepID=A0A2G5BIU4_COERN|nr:Calreticulin-domain-containing protein [Coemansia reversa NRRL 1564]|eukprot:PIA18909.1 Calreticulin-domain-containing protein [Coemansia reversa NRRL 1564]